MFSMIKHSLVTDANNPITKYFQLGRQTASAGPEMVWKIYEAKRLNDGRVRMNTFYIPLNTYEHV